MSVMCGHRSLAIAVLVITALYAAASATAQAVPTYELPSRQHHADSSDDVTLRPSLSATPVITGYSLSSELDPHPLPQESALILDSKLPEVVLFFGNNRSSASPWQYRYRLDYSGADWTETSSRLAHFRNLRPGQYTFEVQSRLPGQPWSSTVSLPVNQKAGFYQTWSFYLLISAVLFALIVAILRQRDRLLKGQIGLVLEERNRIASDCHDTLMAGFSAISWQMEATAKLFGADAANGVEATKSLDLARKMVAHCQAEARRIIWNLRDSDEVIEGLPNALARTVNAVAPALGVRLNLSIQGDEVPINPGAVHHLVCIGQEAITNALRHASPSEVDVHLRYETDALYLTICDNGCGFPDEKALSAVGHFGIATMEERARKLRANLSFRRLRDEITEVSVTLGLLSSASLAKDGHVVPWIGV